MAIDAAAAVVWPGRERRPRRGADSGRMSGRARSTTSLIGVRQQQLPAEHHRQEQRDGPVRAADHLDRPDADRQHDHGERAAEHEADVEQHAGGPLLRVVGAELGEAGVPTGEADVLADHRQQHADADRAGEDDRRARRSGRRRSGSAGRSAGAGGAGAPGCSSTWAATVTGATRGASIDGHRLATAATRMPTPAATPSITATTTADAVPVTRTDETCDASADDRLAQRLQHGVELGQHGRLDVGVRRRAVGLDPVHPQHDAGRAARRPPCCRADRGSGRWPPAPCCRRPCPPRSAGRSPCRRAPDRRTGGWPSRSRSWPRPTARSCTRACR